MKHVTLKNISHLRQDFGVLMFRGIFANPHIHFQSFKGKNTTTPDKTLLHTYSNNTTNHSKTPEDC